MGRSRVWDAARCSSTTQRHRRQSRGSLPRRRASGGAFVDAPVSGGQAGRGERPADGDVRRRDGAFARVEPVIAAYAKGMPADGAGRGRAARPRWSTRFASPVSSRGLPRDSIRQRAGLDVRGGLERDRQRRRESWQMDNRGKTMVDGQVRLRLRGRLDAQGPRHLPRRGASERRGDAGDGAGRPVLRRRQAMGGGRWDTSSLIRRLRRANSHGAEDRAVDPVGGFRASRRGGAGDRAAGAMDPRRRDGRALRAEHHSARWW